MRRRWIAACLVLAALAAGGCTGGGSDDPTATAPATSSPSRPPEPVTQQVEIKGDTVEVQVGPLAVDGDVGVLRVAADTKDGALASFLMNPFASARPSASGVRIVDLDAGTVALPAETASHDVATSWVVSPGGPATDAAEAAAGTGTEILYVAFAAPHTATVDVLLPQGGLVRGVPVVDAADAGTLTVPVAEMTSKAITAKPVVTLGSYTEQAGGAVRTREEPKKVQVDVGSDVLFAVDADQLGPDADATLSAVGDQLAASPGGSLTIVGHTDDVRDDAYNQALSERRARSVADRLGALADLSGFDVTVQGAGESDPAVEGTSEAARAQNRRVTITFTPSAEPAPAAAPTGQVPAATGPTAAGSEPVQITERSHDNLYSVSAQEVRRIGHYLVGTLSLTNAGTVDDDAANVLANSAWDARGAFDPSLQYSATNVSLLVGDTRVYAVDYAVGDKRRNPLADLLLKGYGAGQTHTVTVIWPDPGGETVVIDSPRLTADLTDNVTIDLGGSPFRLTDVPVTDD